mgnify:CR=1 FL=1|tara:strand:- start:790 stop:1701 length:912 start_codon:yes stop_codon:yes gene_type:complete
MKLQDLVIEKKKPKPTNPSKWSYYKSQAKKKFDVYPSAYANAWAAKMYKKAGGGWRMSKEAVDGLQYHFDNAIPLRESVYRPGSKSFFEMFELARALYEQGMIEVDWEDAELLETSIGDIVKTAKGNLVLDIPFNEDSEYDDVLAILKKHPAEHQKLKQDGEIEYAGPLYMDLFDYFSIEGYMPYGTQKARDGDPDQWIHDRLDSLDLLEAEYQGRDVELNKPKRGGSRKFYVYVKNPKTGKIKKVSFGGITGLSVKANDPARVRSFVARHDCKNKNDKTKPSYWSCRLPRYKNLGIKGGQWW